METTVAGSATWHRLSDVDLAKKRATCSRCGSVSIIVRSGRRGHECAVARVARRARLRTTTTVERRREQRYGMVANGFENLLEAQGGRCAVCSVAVTYDTAVIDHDHSCCPRKWSCGECVRGILCRTCNLGLGHFRDSPGLLESAIEYLAR